MPGKGYGSKLSNVDRQPGHKVGDICTFGGEGVKNSTGNRREEPYTSSADEANKFSFHALRIPNRTNGRASAQCSSAWHECGLQLTV
jgi:hypothetical protein